jgi:hypothetical protein
MLFWYALGATRRTKFQVVQSIVVLPIVGLKKKLTLHSVSSRVPETSPLLIFTVGASTLYNEIKSYTQDGGLCKINFTFLRQAVKNEGWPASEISSENSGFDFSDIMPWVFQSI